MIRGMRSFAVALAFVAGCSGTMDVGDGGGIDIDAQLADMDSGARDAGAFVQVCEGTASPCRLLENATDCNAVLGCGWTQCAGFPVRCTDQFVESACTTLSGCSWDGARCSGTPAPCSAILAADACRMQTGCTWTPIMQCRGNATPCDTLDAARCDVQPGCREHVPRVDAGPVDSGPRDAWVPMCDPDGGMPTGCVAPSPPSPLTGCNPTDGVECDGDWTGTSPMTGMPYCSPACGAGECCTPRDGRFQCHPRGADGSCPAADIFIDATQIEGRFDIEWQEFRADSCEIAEACVQGTGMRRLLRFDTWTPNIGEADLFLGQPTTPSDVFTFSPCHGHHHFDSYAQYELLSADACCVAASGHKQAFCLIDLARYDETIGGPTGVYGCGYQGIQRGYQDIYSSGLDCQFVDITDVPPGDYILRIRVNVDHILNESDYSNNEINVPVTID
jgi:hypothetical protein